LVDRAEAVIDGVDGSASIADRGPVPLDENGVPRKRRRRRRRGSRGRDRDDAPKTRPTDSADPVHDEDDEIDVDEESITRERIRAEGLTDDLDDPQDEEGGEDAHLFHRGIPTWEEAVGMIVNVNLESRAKNPNSSSGNRGGRGRGGRDRDRRR